MSREEFSKLIGPYLDNELSAEDREKVDAYLASSEEYRQMASELEELTRLARGDRPPEVDDDRWREMLSQIREGGEGRPFSIVSSRARWLAPLAGLAAVLVIGLFISSTGPDSSVKPDSPAKEYAETEDEDTIRIETIDDDEKKEELKPADPRFDD